MQYVIREHSSLLSREMVIEDRHSKLLYRVKGPLVRIRDELRLENASGVEQAFVKDPVPGDSKTFEIYRGGNRTAVVDTVGVGNLLEGYDVMVEHGQPLQARGDLFGRDFTITTQGRPAARVHRGHGNALEVDTEPGQDEVLLLASVVAMAAMLELRTRAANQDA